METNFKELKEEIIKRAKAADACTSEYKRAYKSESFEELLQVIKDNFDFAVSRKVIDIELIKLYENEFNNNKIYGNIDISEGYLLVDNATVEASDNAYITSYHTIECVLSDNSIYRIRESNTIKYASDEIKFEKYKATSTN